MFENFILFARPWWVNLFILLPFIAYYFWRNKLEISVKTLLAAGIFAVAFGFVEAAVVVYLRQAAGIAENFSGAANFLPQTEVLYLLPKNLLHIEVAREATTMLIIPAVAFLSVKTRLERWAVYFWIFALWDIFYYVGLYLAIGWPPSLTTPDVLFLIPVPWYSQVWFPCFASVLFLIGVLWGRKK